MHLVSFGDAIVQYSCAMNTQCIHHSFCNCMFVAGRGGTRVQIRTLVFMPHRWWKSDYIHTCIVGWTQLRYLCTIRLVFTYCFISLEIFMPCKSGYNHELLFLCHTSGGNLDIFMHILLAGFS